MKSLSFSKHIIYCLVSVSTFMFYGCRDDLKWSDTDEVIEGLPTVLNVTVSVPEMSVMTRADYTIGDAITDPEDVKKVYDCWIGIFDMNGEKTGQYVFDEADNDKVHDIYDKIKVEIPVRSGKAYVVAVANAKGKKALMPNYNNTDNSSSGSNLISKEFTTETYGTTDLLEILKLIKNWEDYKHLITYMSDPSSIGRVNDQSFIMSGFYKNDPHLNNPDLKTYAPLGVLNEGDENYMAQISADGSTSVVVHLNRLEAYNRFNIKAGDYVTIEPVSWKVVNVPALSFIHNQDQNASDVYVQTSGLFNSGYAYNESEEYEAYHFNKIYNEGGTETRAYSFDFYLMENKHTGIISQDKFDKVSNPYNLREFEHKDGTLNTGWYESLVEKVGNTIPAKPSNAEAEVNNNASYVVVNLKVSYWYTNNDPTKPVEAPNDLADSKYVYRTSDVNYTIHLGYCEGKNTTDGKATLTTANDFNCRRNTKYTYDVTINGVDNVRVEATTDNEPQPGVEGMVTDVTGEVFNLDSHYGVVNIKLSDKERSNLMWILQTPYGGNVITMMGGNIPEDFKPNGIINTNDESDDESNNLQKNLPNNQFYNWVQIMGTTGENIIADYHGDKRHIQTDNNYYDKIFYLNDLCMSEDDNGTEEQWYSIFIDEYVYNHEYDSSLANMTKGDDKYDNWKDYVNLGDRKLWLLVMDEDPNASDNKIISGDTESIYNFAKYHISQESIQTYYNDLVERCIGVESLNESYNKNAWDWESFNGNVYSNDDGLVNQFNYVKANEENKQWANVFKKTNENNLVFRNGYEDNPTEKAKKFYIPDHKDKYMKACLARNRDLNGDGTIDDDEIRWYLPTEATYTRIILGTPALRSPLYKAKDYRPGLIPASVGTTYSHYAGSNNRQTWAEELAATGTLGNAGNLRCIRNLGTDPNTAPDDPDYKGPQTAYTHDEDNRIINMEFFLSTSLRPATQYSIKTHDITQSQALTAKRFKYAKENCIWATNDLSQRNIDDAYQDQDPRLKMFYFHPEDNDDKDIFDVYDGIYWGPHQNNNADYFNRITTFFVLEERYDRHNLWEQSVNANSICKYYYEDKEGKSDLGTWRVPNITELGILFLVDDKILPRNTSYISCSTEYCYYVQDGHTEAEKIRRFMGIRGLTNDISARIDGDPYVRCVKDVEENN